jgi:hypothetical protein
MNIFINDFSRELSMRNKINILGSPDNNCEEDSIVSLKEDRKNVKRRRKEDENRSDGKSNINHLIINRRIF